jgi:Fur family ferric uptake transcriptional regulator
MRRDMSTTQEKNMLNRRGYKLTEQRQGVLNLLKSEKRHLNAIDIHNELRRKKQHVSLATVYRTLNLLARLNLVKKVNVGHKPSVFEFDGYTRKNREHVHLVCGECGRVIDIVHPELSKLLEIEHTLSEQYHFMIANIQISFIGSCADCNMR